MSLFDLTSVEAPSYKPLKAGKYLTCITEAKVEPLFSGKGNKLSVKIKIMEGEYKDRNIFHSFNVKHENKDAELIGKQQLKGLMHCIGLGDILNETAELLGKSFVTVTKIQKDNVTGDEKTRVSYFEKAEGKHDFSSVNDEVIPF
jgi:hypothetical protein